MSCNIRVCQLIEFIAIKGEAFGAERYLGQLGPELGIELVAVHAQIARRIAVPDEAGLNLRAHDQTGGTISQR